MGWRHAFVQEPTIAAREFRLWGFLKNLQQVDTQEIRDSVIFVLKNLSRKSMDPQLGLHRQTFYVSCCATAQETHRFLTHACPGTALQVRCCGLPRPHRTALQELGYLA